MTDVDMEAIGLQPMGHGQHTLATKFVGWPQWSAVVMVLQQGVAHKFE